MSRISLISLLLLVVLAVLCIHTAMNAPWVSVGDASVQSSLSVCGGAGVCAFDMPTSICYGENKRCWGLKCDGTDVGFFAPEIVWSCSKTGHIRHRWISWDCTYISFPEGQKYPSFSCGPLTSSWCFNRDTCAQEPCTKVGASMMCKTLKTKLPPIKEGRFDERVGDGKGCVIQSTASTNRGKSNIACLLPSFAIVRSGR